jgi:hypothetical protein
MGSCIKLEYSQVVQFNIGDKINPINGLFINICLGIIIKVFLPIEGSFVHNYLFSIL